MRGDDMTQDERYRKIKRFFYITYDQDAVTYIKKKLGVSRQLVWATISGTQISPKVARFISKVMNEDLFSEPN
jgi:vesicle coat complex subunit